MGGFTYGRLHYGRSVHSKHRTLNHKNETITVDFRGQQLRMFFEEVMVFQQTVATTKWL